MSVAAELPVRPVTDGVLDWYRDHARDLPWRRPEASPWSIVVSEFMLQQTPVSRVLEPWRTWMQRWPTPAALAAAPAGEAVRAWGRLGYPRRALRLHQTAGVLVDRHGGEVPQDLVALRALPGVGDYTAAAIASFAFGARQVVLDTNVRRVLARLARGEAAAAPSVTAADRSLAEAFLPAEPGIAARWAVASMELGALVCTARSPRCAACPVQTWCRWHAAGRPPAADRTGCRQAYGGTDRQCRGALLAVLRTRVDPVPASELSAAWPDQAQQARSLASLRHDGLVEQVADASYALPR